MGAENGINYDQALPATMEQALDHLFAKTARRDIELAAFLDVVGPIYLEFAALSHEVSVCAEQWEHE